MKLIVCLGNPGDKYKQTRHNAGFIIGDLLREKWSGENWREEKKFSGIISLVSLPREDDLGHIRIILLKPQTFMNLSGESVEKVIRFFQIQPENILVIHDDKDLPFGTIRFKSKGGHGGHRGIASIIEHKNSDEFARLKIGVETREENSQIDTSDFVLSRFTKEELEQVQKKIFPESEKTILKWLQD